MKKTNKFLVKEGHKFLLLFIFISFTTIKTAIGRNLGPHISSPVLSDQKAFGDLDPTDVNGCTPSSSVVLPSVFCLSVSVFGQNPTCSATYNGSAYASVSGGTPPYSYYWSAGDSPGGQGMLAVATGSCGPGVVSVSVYDSGGCSATGSITLVSAIDLIISTSSTPASCSSGTDGTATVTTISGSYVEWLTLNQFGQTVTNLSPGTYPVEVSNFSISPIGSCYEYISVTVGASNVSFYDSIQVTTCGTYLSPSGQVWSSSGTYTDIIPSVSGCDSIISIDLTINPISLTIDTIETCDDFLSPNGQIWSSSGTYNDTLSSFSGCDSIASINLIITPINPSVSDFGDSLRANDITTNYQWIKCFTGEHIPGETNRTFDPAVGGTYAVILSKQNCIDTSSCISVANIAIQGSFENKPAPNEINGINSEAASKINLYPNPNNGQFVIDLGDEYEDIRISITDLTGRLIYSHPTYTLRMINANVDLPSGIYLVKVVATGLSKTFRLMVK